MAVKLSELSAFLAVADHLSFQRAAIERGVSRSALSHSLRSLEAALEIRLLSRNTRSVSLTDAGKSFYDRLKPAFNEIDQAIEDVNRFRDTPHGAVRLTVPRAIGLSVMGPVIARLVRENPGLSIEISSSDALVDIVAEGFDAGIRFGERLQQDMIAARIGLAVSFAVVGSPAYFAGRTVPDVPDDLRGHQCVRYRFPSGVAFPWEFEKNGQAVQIAVDGPVQLDDQELMIEAALSGVGLAFVFTDRVQPYLDSGKLVRCLADWSPQLPSLYLYYPSRRFVSAGLRALIDLLKKPLAELRQG
ncbi:MULTISPECIES: LysR family transcriptional regulator [unclassified Novosphingobium]|uniref:LysR family transcriptional regulator n=1 Tax=unclassified Novosphingobium TaxID=2644732 RepID=UPI0013584D7A|nr:MULTISPECIES: LysR family transcriptional regulator [unclassified Novosphingobium]